MSRSLMFGVLGVLVASPVFAHVKIISHPMRFGVSAIKTFPCGDSPDVRSQNINTFLSGSTITLIWDEFVPHPGHFRVAFDDDGDDFPDPQTNTDFFPPTPEGTTIIGDDLFDHTNTTDPIYSYDVPLPDIECDNCTLQLIQVMTEGGGNRMYYNCLDVRLTRDPSKVPDPNVEFAGGSCAVESRSSRSALPPLALLGLSGVAAFLYRRRRR